MDPGGEAVGPELRQMGPMHPSEYFAESIMNPEARMTTPLNLVEALESLSPGHKT